MLLFVVGKFCLNEGKVFWGHLIIFISHEPRLILFHASDFPNDLQKGRQLLFGGLLGGLDPQNARVGLDIQESLEHEVLLLKDKALFHLRDDPFLRVFLLKHIDVVTSSDLALFLDFFTLQLESHFVRICVRVVFADLVEHVAITNLSFEENLLDLKCLNFQVVMKSQLWVLVVHHN